MKSTGEKDLGWWQVKGFKKGYEGVKSDYVIDNDVNGTSHTQLLFLPLQAFQSGGMSPNGVPALAPWVC